MKKKLFLLPITLTTLTPMISMVGCSNIADYQINLDDIETIIGLEDVKYLQIDGIEQVDAKHISTFNNQLSPSVFHNMQTINKSKYLEQYIYLEDGDQYFKKTRTNRQDQFSEPTPADKTEFKTPKDYGQICISWYDNFKKKGGILEFDNNSKCYKAELYMKSEEELVMHASLEFHFFQNKMVKFKTSDENFIHPEYNASNDFNIKYDEIIPVVPD